MPSGEPGGPDTEVFFDFGESHKFHEKSKYKNQKCHVNCDCGRYWEIGNSVFMQYQKMDDGSFKQLPKQNVDFGGGLERFIGATEDIPDMFQTSLFSQIIKSIEDISNQKYTKNKSSMQIVADHLIGSSFIIASGITPSNKDQGYILRRQIRRAFDHFAKLGGKDISAVVEAIVGQYKDTDPVLVEKFENIKLTLLEEIEKYTSALHKAKAYIIKKYSAIGDELKGIKEISADDAFYLYASHGLSPTQIESLGYMFDKQVFARKMEEHQKLSRQGAGQKFRGGLADHQEKTIMGHTATHLLHQALRDLLGKHVHQSGSNITTSRLRFDFNYDQKLTDEQIHWLEKTVNDKIQENIPVHFELIPTSQAHKIGAIGLFMDTYGEKSKIYFIGGDSKHPEQAYSIEFCGGPHVDFTAMVKSFKIIKQENIGNKQRRLYAIVG
jgi:alanyl-tRNA synthetase